MRFFDLHCDTAVKAYTLMKQLTQNDLAVSFEKGDAFTDWRQCFAIWIDDRISDPYGFYLKVLEYYRTAVKSAPKNLTPYLTVEGGTLIEDDIGRIEKLKEDGVCALTLTWNGENQIACGAYADGGLKPFGREVIKELNRYKIACDLSHLNEKSFFQALELSEIPIATHSCCCYIHPHSRNLTDEQLIALVKKGGIVGIALYKEFLGGDCFKGFYNNVEHLISLGLEDSIAVGSDFDGCEMSSELSDISKIKNLYTYMQGCGLDKKLLDKIFFSNAEKYFSRFNND